MKLKTGWPMKGLCLIFLIVFSVRANAYVFTKDIQDGAYWPSFPIAINNLIVEGKDPLTYKLVQKAVKAWEEELGRDIWSLQDQEGRLSSKIYWSTNFAEETGHDPNYTLAVTIRHRTGNTLEKVLIVLNGQLDFLRNNEDGILEKTILHELGHSIGLGHSHEEAIMKAEISHIGKLQYDDIVGGEATLAKNDHNRQNDPHDSDDDSSLGDALLAGCGTIKYVGNPPTSGGLMTSFIMGIFFSFILLIVARLQRPSLVPIKRHGNRPAQQNLFS